MLEALLKFLTAFFIFGIIKLCLLEIFKNDTKKADIFLCSYICCRFLWYGFYQLMMSNTRRENDL